MSASERFRIEGQLGRGGMGTVWKALDTVSGSTVAIKFVESDDPEHQARFEREAAVLATLDHPGIVKYVAHGELDGRRYLAMEWVDGETLHARLARTGLSIVETIAVGRQVAAALDHAHARGIVHRDIKPTNLIACGGDLEHIAVLDFGVARVAGAVGSLTETGALIGTPSYMAPEQARGDRDLGARVDVFALGCVMYECLTGRMTFEGTHLLALIAKVVLWEPPPPHVHNPDVPAALDELIVAMISKDPDARPATGAEVSARLAAIPRAVLHEVPRRGRPVSPPTVAGLQAPHRSRRPASLVVATSPAGADGAAPVVAPDELATRRRTLAAVLAAFDVRVDVLYDGSIVVIVANAREPAQLVGCAVQCARAVRAVIPDALVAIATSEIDDDGDLAAQAASAMLDGTVKALARDAMAVVFANVSAIDRPHGAIRIDDATAKHTREPIVRIGRTAYLAGAGATG